MVKNNQPITKEEFIKRSVEKHGDAYGYDKVVHVNSTTKVEIFCNKHQEYFWQTPKIHKTASCPKCGRERQIKFAGKGRDKFIQDSIDIYGDKYDYSKVEYSNNKTLVKLTCNKCGKELEERPDLHLRGNGCNVCEKAQTKHNNEDIFKEVTYKIHGDKHDYSKLKCNGKDNKVTIICKEHQHEFKLSIESYARGQGCPLCTLGGGSIYNKKGYVHTAKGRDTILYLIECKKGKEVFYKIGKTFQTIKNRFRPSLMPYKYKILFEYIEEAGFIYDLEIELHKKYRNYKHIPKINFAGRTECYTMNLPIEEIINI
jgi:hypothetical protein